MKKREAIAILLIILSIFALSLSLIIDFHIEELEIETHEQLNIKITSEKNIDQGAILPHEKG